MNKNVGDWVFNFNIYTNKWRAAKRENYNSLFSSFGDENVLKSSSIDTLIEIITKTNGDRELIDKLFPDGGKQ